MTTTWVCDSPGARGQSPESTRPRCVSLLIGQLGLGGTEKQVVLLATGLARRGIRTRVLVMFDGGPYEDALRAAGVPVVRLRCPRIRAPRLSLEGLTGLRRAAVTARMAGRAAYRVPLAAAAVLRLAAELRRERTDVLHAFLPHSFLAAAAARWIGRVPVLVAGRRSLAKGAYDRRSVLALVRAANRVTDLVIANADAVAADARSVERLAPSKIVTVYNGIADQAFDPVPAASLAADTPVVLCIANLIWYKGHRYLLQAAATLRERGTACTLVLAGDGPERESLELMAAELSLDARFLGHRTDIGALLARADVCVLPSVTEGLSNAVMEAMAAGKAVVATDVGGNGELLREGRGVLVPPRDADALARAITRILGDPVFAVALGAKARRWSRTHLRADAMVERHLQLYARLLEGECAA